MSLFHTKKKCSVFFLKLSLLLENSPYFHFRYLQKGLNENSEIKRHVVIKVKTE